MTLVITDEGCRGFAEGIQNEAGQIPFWRAMLPTDEINTVFRVAAKGARISFGGLVLYTADDVEAGINHCTFAEERTGAKIEGHTLDQPYIVDFLCDYLPLLQDVTDYPVAELTGEGYRLVPDDGVRL